MCNLYDTVFSHTLNMECLECKRSIYLIIIIKIYVKKIETHKYKQSIRIYHVIQLNKYLPVMS